MALDKSITILGEQETACFLGFVGSSYLLYEGTEFGRQDLNKLLIVNKELGLTGIIDLHNKGMAIVNELENGIPPHFVEIGQSRFNFLIKKYYLA